MAPLSPHALARLTDELTSRAAFRRPDLSTAFSDDGWVAIHVPDVVITSAGLAFRPGDVAIARPAVACHRSDFLAFSDRLATLVGLRHGEDFTFVDELQRAAAA